MEIDKVEIKLATFKWIRVFRRYYLLHSLCNFTPLITIFPGSLTLRIVCACS